MNICYQRSLERKRGKGAREKEERPSKGTERLGGICENISENSKHQKNQKRRKNAIISKLVGMGTGNSWTG